MRELLALLLSAFNRRSDDLVESSLAPYAGLDSERKPEASGLLNPEENYPGLTSESSIYLRRVK